MKKIIFTIICISIFCSMASSQQIAPSGIYGAAQSSTVGNVSLNWVIGTLTPTTVSALPVKLISFKGTLTSSGNARLEWKTSEEVNNKGFEIQKSTDAKHFEKIAWIDGAGSKEGKKTYEFTDKDLATTSYYRLKQIDYDEKFTLSRILTVIPENESLDRFTAFPNPSRDGIIRVTIPDKTISLMLSDQKGTLVKLPEISAFQHQISLPSPGLYLLRIKTATGEKTLKLVRE